MAKATVGGGASNGAAQEPPAEEPAAPAAQAPAAPAGPARLLERAAELEAEAAQLESGQK